MKKQLPKRDYKVLKMKELKPAKYNPRIMLEEQLAELEASIKSGGMVQPIVVNKDMTIIGGHQRHKVLERMGIKEDMCVVVDLNKLQEKKLNLSLNKVVGFWDEEKLVELIYEMKDDNIAGFSQEEKDQYIMQKEIMLENTGSYDPDEDEELKKIFERNEKVPVKVEEPDAMHKKNQLAFYTETFEEYEKIRKYFKTSRNGELDKDKLIETLK